MFSLEKRGLRIGLIVVYRFLRRGSGGADTELFPPVIELERWPA